MKRIIAITAAVVLMLTLTVAAFASNGEKTATPSKTKFVMDGKEITFDVAYNIEDSNYLQLRSVAQALNGTKSQFNVYWDNDLRQAVIETGKPYTGVKPETGTPNLSYKVGDSVTVGNAEITVTKVFTTSNVNNGNAIASEGEVFYGITLSVTTSDQPYSGRYWVANYFVSHILTTDGVRYEMPFSVGDDNKIYPNQKGSGTVYIAIAQGDTIASVIVSNGQGNNATISVE